MSEVKPSLWMRETVMYFNKCDVTMMKQTYKRCPPHSVWRSRRKIQEEFHCLSLESQTPKHKKNEVHWDTRFFVENEWCYDGKCGWHVVSPGVGDRGINAGENNVIREIQVWEGLCWLLQAFISLPHKFPGLHRRIFTEYSICYELQSFWKVTFYECRFKMLKKSTRNNLFPGVSWYWVLSCYYLPCHRAIKVTSPLTLAACGVSSYHRYESHFLGNALASKIYKVCCMSWNGQSQIDEHCIAELQ